MSDRNPSEPEPEPEPEPEHRPNIADFVPHAPEDAPETFSDDDSPGMPGGTLGTGGAREEDR